jgi:hypothetical protein
MAKGAAPGSAAVADAEADAAIAISATTKSTQYYAIRQCDSLDGPAVFTSWKDCSFYLEGEDDNDNDNTDKGRPVIYEIFQDMLRAVNYIYQYEKGMQRNKLHQAGMRSSNHQSAFSDDSNPRALVSAVTHQK